MTQSDLVTNHIPLVRSIATKLVGSKNKRYWDERKDALVTEGIIALVKCADRFDSERGVTFGQFARVSIRNAMIRFLQRNSRNRNDTVSLDDRDEDGIPYHSSIGGDGQVEMIALRDELKHHLHPVEEWVVVKRYFEKMRMDDIAAQLGFPESRVSQIHKNAIRKLKRAFGPSSQASSGEKPQEENPNDNSRSDLLQVVRKMMWDEWGVEVSL